MLYWLIYMFKMSAWLNLKLRPYTAQIVFAHQCVRVCGPVCGCMCIHTHGEGVKKKKEFLASLPEGKREVAQTLLLTLKKYPKLREIRC